ncbi:MAG TPA: TatD family hydrolase, partial [Patescibacteria group bacterium]|nr:TatD family hydrolase [Patescibacteria group bacterium]
MKFIDTHAHVNFRNFKDDADKVIARALDNDTGMVLVGAEYRTSRRALEYVNKYERGVYAAVGLHPLHLEKIEADEGEEGGFETRGETFVYDNYEKLANFEKVVAIGEIGLDYYHIKISSRAEEIK